MKYEIRRTHKEQGEDVSCTFSIEIQEEKNKLTLEVDDHFFSSRTRFRNFINYTLRTLGINNKADRESIEELLV